MMMLYIRYPLSQQPRWLNGVSWRPEGTSAQSFGDKFALD